MEEWGSKSKGHLNAALIKADQVVMAPDKAVLVMAGPERASMGDGVVKMSYTNDSWWTVTYSRRNRFPSFLISNCSSFFIMIWC